MFFTVYHILQDFSITDCASAQTIKILIGSRGADEKNAAYIQNAYKKANPEKHGYLLRILSIPELTICPMLFLQEI